MCKTPPQRHAKSTLSALLCSFHARTLYYQSLHRLSMIRLPLAFSPQIHESVAKPLLKKPSLDHSYLKTFCSVSNLSFLSKIIEKRVLLQFSYHLFSYQILSSLPGQSTETALFETVNISCFLLIIKNMSVVTFLDLSAEFDTIDSKSS